ncbi:MAG: phosphoribosylamine--glycine ligase [Saprospiraceae bacterium]|nr:phosphoribosylamine--glycine ligase [Saprospiraceae bacterium]
MNILILGSGGREHCLAWKINQSPLCDTLYIAPGNAGTRQCGQNVDLNILDFESVKKFALDHNIDMIVVGPEAPLVDGIVDFFRQADTAHIKMVGPDAYAAQLEGSKAFAKKFMEKYQIPTAAYTEVTSENLQEGIRFLDSLTPPYVLKADGLAAGKGVLILENKAKAVSELQAMLSGKFGQASSRVVIETFLKGIEFSVFVLTDGKEYVLLPEAKDYKRVGEGDTGLNTGGMGAISPVPFVNDSLWDKVKKKIIEPTIHGIRAEQMDYKGFVFFGLINVEGEPYVIEYNCRLGDPETEVVIPRISTDIVELFNALFDGTLSSRTLKISPMAASTVMMVSGGYPGDFEKGKPITGLSNAGDVTIFHAGTKASGEDILTNGGRVLALTAMDRDFRKAVAKSVAAAETIQFEGKYFRKDIGFDL